MMQNTTVYTEECAKIPPQSCGRLITSSQPNKNEMLLGLRDSYIFTQDEAGFDLFTLIKEIII